MKRLAIALLVLLAGCTDSPELLKARDGQELAYAYHPGGWKGIILLHQLDGSKEDWEPLERHLEREGYSYLALDFRGHGQSPGEWEHFDNEDFAAVVYDVEAAHRFLKVQGVDVFAVVGASIGANVALKYARWKDVGAVVLLSPGFDYRGIDISEDIGNYTGDVLVFAGLDDSYSLTTAQVFERDINATFVRVAGQQHGTEMLTEAIPHIVTFLERNKN
jgi:pimeloyl-ACP methyl ester carboxylesterase